MSKKLDEIEELVNHQPCCDHRNHHYGNCTDCYNTGCAHQPYVEGEAKKDMQQLVRAVRYWPYRAAAIGLASAAGGAAARYGLWQWVEAVTR